MEHRKAKLSDFACNSTLFVFGHSLDVTDGDILRKLICNDNICTKIFYYREYEDDKRTLGKLIKNVVKVIGMDEVVRRTGGETKTIEFLLQAIVEQKNKYVYGRRWSARLFHRKGTDLRDGIVCELVPSFMPCKNGYGFLQSTYRTHKI